jgi:peptidyl-prolyl cis-trans isomerase B (cyclophilin B)
VSPTKRERERAYQRRRYEQWETRRKEHARRRRRAVVAWLVISAILVSTLTGVILVTTMNDGAPAPDTAPVAEPLPTTTPAQYDAAPSPDEAEGRTWTATLQTSVGDITLELDGAAAPQAVASFNMLARNGFYDGTGCHRLVVGQLLQCGDPTGTGAGGPGYTFGPIENAPADQLYPAGTVAMGRRDNDASSQGSQFFLVLGDTPLPDDSAGGYTVFGRITEGLDLLTVVSAGGTVDGGSDGQPALPVTIEGVVVQ